MDEDLYDRGPSPPPSAGMAQASMWTGIASMAFIMISPCLCYMTVPAAFPLAIISMILAFQGLSDDTPLPGTRAMAMGGLVSSTLSLLFCLAIGLFVGGYIALVAIVALTQ